MIMRRFDYERDAETVGSWLKPRGLTMVPRDQLPEVGFIVEGVAVAFVYKAEGGLAVIDRLVTNPMSTPEERNNWVALIFRQLQSHAVSGGAKQVVAFSDRTSTAKWLEAAGLSKHSDGAFYFSAGG